ncbi:RHS repeat-associated core domain-containing protein [Pseudanabaenaceae cyanobacterium LEGE 13415]|nr:RHS repeat-associated core domain-containing protein [Pseudanabaenaceae cyanobacterium LEGE 13415]
MRIGADGKPVYYLSDGMGSVIGLADQAGQSAAKFAYDSFGEMRSQSGTLANSNSAGGDFRFQGQWLESATGIYHFRARDYDSKTGTFLSRDPVDPNEQQPEALNPYQAMYNNPYMYSDPSGEIAISIGEFNAAQVIQSSLQSIRTYGAAQAKRQLTGKIYESIGNAALNALSGFIPNIDSLLPSLSKNGGNYFEALLTEAICDFFRFDSNQLFFQPGVNYAGNALSLGVTCGEVRDPEALKRAEAATLGKTRRPDFIVTPPGSVPRRSTKNGTKLVSGGPDPSWIIGDIKLSTKTLVNDYVKGGNKQQWKAIRYYAGRNAYYVAGFMTLFGEGKDYQSNVQKVIKEAVKEPVPGRLGSYGIIAAIATAFPAKSSPFGN